MNLLRRRWGVLVTVSVLSLALAACSPPATEPALTTGSTAESGSDDSSSESSSGEGSGSPTPVPTDADSDLDPTTESSGESVSAPVFTAVAPAPRLPVTCAQLMASLPGLTGGTASPMYEGYFLEAVVLQAGFLRCQMSSEVASVPVSIQIMVGVEIPETMVQGRVDAAAAAGHHTNLGADLSYSDCGKVAREWKCSSGIYANGYFAEISISRNAPATSASDAATIQFMESLATRIASWGSPAPAWQAPAEALRWETDCETDVARTDSAIAAAAPFPIGTPSSGFVDEFTLSAVANERAGLTYCTWGVNPHPSLTVAILPGASWMFAQPGALTGSPHTFPGALATLSVSPVKNSAARGYSAGTLWLVIDDSSVMVSVASAYDMPSIPTAQLTSVPTDVAEALISDLR